MQNEDKTFTEKPGKEKGWYTAFYCLAEYVRVLTEGALNHKMFYALVGDRASYVNNACAQVRRSSAGTLSRIIHSSRYAQSMQDRHAEQPECFDNAAATLADLLAQSTALDAEALLERFSGEALDQVRAGLLQEFYEGRTQVNVSRLDTELALLRAWVERSHAANPSLCLQRVLSSCFYLLAYAHLDESFANSLVDDVPTDLLLEEASNDDAQSLRACIIRLAEGDGLSIENMWALADAETFHIGRYMDCNAIEVESVISRRHCSIFRAGDTWMVQDSHSRYGTAVIRKGETVWSSLEQGSEQVFSLEFDDDVVLAGRIRYKFVSLQNIERMLVG